MSPINPPSSAPSSALADVALFASTFASETFHPAAATTQFQVNTGELIACSLALTGGVAITKLYCNMAAAGAGAGFARLALYDKTAGFVRQTADMNATFAGALGLIVGTLTSSFTPATTDDYAIAVLTAMAVTQPQLCAGKTNALGLGAGPAGKFRCFLQAGLAAFPTPAVPAASDGWVWFAAS